MVAVVSGFLTAVIDSTKASCVMMLTVRFAVFSVLVAVYLGDKMSWFKVESSL